MPNGPVHRARAITERRGIAASSTLPGLVVLALTALVAGCATVPPSNLTDVCSIFREEHGWYKSAKLARDRWGMPIHVQMAIIHQESRFLDDAKPPRFRFLGLPLWRVSSAYGYAQVKDATWDWYIQKTGNRGADRDDFADAVDFIGWYGDLTRRQLGVSLWDAYNQYLAYHEGHGGFKRKSYRHKDWLIAAARKVQTNAKRYSEQLARCREELDRPWYWPF